MSVNGVGIHEFIQLNGLAFHTTNYTLVLVYQHLPNFSTNVTSDIIETNNVLRNLTYAKQVEDILLNMAASL